MDEDRETVIAAAEAVGYQLVQSELHGQTVWGFRGRDDRYPKFTEERQAISYMADWLRRGRTFRAE